MSFTIQIVVACMPVKTLVSGEEIGFRELKQEGFDYKRFQQAEFYCNSVARPLKTGTARSVTW